MQVPLLLGSSIVSAPFVTFILKRILNYHILFVFQQVYCNNFEYAPEFLASRLYCACRGLVLASALRRTTLFYSRAAKTARQVQTTQTWARGLYSWVLVPVGLFVRYPRTPSDKQAYHHSRACQEALARSTPHFICQYSRWVWEGRRNWASRTATCHLQNSVVFTSHAILGAMVHYSSQLLRQRACVGKPNQRPLSRVFWIHEVRFLLRPSLLANPFSKEH